MFNASQIISPSALPYEYSSKERTTGIANGLGYKMFTLWAEGHTNN